jgi:hypothetical protein
VCDNGEWEARYTHASGRELEPENEDGLEGIVEGEIVEDDADGKRLDKVEKAEDHPVRQPLDVVLMPGRLECAEAEVGWESPADEVRRGRSEGVDEDEEGAEDSTAEGQHRLGDLHAGLDVVEDWVARELQGEARKGRGQRQHGTAHDWKNRGMERTSLSSWEL